MDNYEALQELDRRMRKSRRAYKRDISGGYAWLATQISKDILRLSELIHAREENL